MFEKTIMTFSQASANPSKYDSNVKRVYFFKEKVANKIFYEFFIQLLLKIKFGDVIRVFDSCQNTSRSTKTLHPKLTKFELVLCYPKNQFSIFFASVFIKTT